MARVFVAALTFFLGSRAFADSPLPPPYFEVGYASGKTHTSGSTTDDNINGVNGTAVIPLPLYLSATVSGAYMRTNLHGPFISGSTSNASSRCAVDNRDWQVGLNLREPTVGKLGVSYGAGTELSGCAVQVLGASADKISTTNYAATAEYYFSRFTVGVTGTRTRVASARDLNSSQGTLTWYATNDFSVSTSVQDLAGTSVYGIGLAYRPEVIEGATRLSVEYDIHREAPKANVIMLNLTYYFDQHLDLMTRDRVYR